MKQGGAADSRGDYKQAYTLYKQAADAGYTAGMMALGDMCSYYGHLHYCPGDDNTEAMKWYRMAESRGDPDGTNGIAFLYQQGAGVPRNIVYAMSLYIKAANGGSKNAMHTLGAIYSQEFPTDGVATNYSESKKWHELASAAGDFLSMVSLAGLYLGGLGVQKNQTIADQWISRALKESKGVAGVYVLSEFADGGGTIPGYSKDCSMALTWLQRIIEDYKSPWFMMHKGELYISGTCVTKDMSQAREWLTKAAAAARADPQNPDSRDTLKQVNDDLHKLQ